MKKSLIIGLLLLTTKLSAVIYLDPPPHFKPRAEVATVYIEHNGQILLLHRQDNKPQGNKWGIPGGKIEANETPLQAVIRETIEETGYDISNETIEIMQTIYIEFDKRDQFVYHMFRIQPQTTPEAVLLNSKEHKGYTWVTPGKALTMDLMKDQDESIKLIYFPNVHTPSAKLPGAQDVSVQEDTPLIFPNKKALYNAITGPIKIDCQVANTVLAKLEPIIGVPIYPSELAKKIFEVAFTDPHCLSPQKRTEFIGYILSNLGRQNPDTILKLYGFYYGYSFEHFAPGIK